jgi:hypothetical protein
LRAARILEPIVASQPHNGRADWLLSQSLAAMGDLERALKLADVALASDPSNVAHHVQVAAVAGRLAEKSSLLKQLTLARRAQRNSMRRWPLTLPIPTEAQWGLMIYYYAAPALEDPISFETAAALANLYIEQKPNQARAD